MDIGLNWPFVFCSSWLQGLKCSLHHLCLAGLLLTITFSGQLSKLSLRDLVSSSSLLLAYNVCLHHPAHYTFFCPGIPRVPSGAEFHLSSVMICLVSLFYWLPSLFCLISLFSTVVSQHHFSKKLCTLQSFSQGCSEETQTKTVSVLRPFSSPFCSSPLF